MSIHIYLHETKTNSTNSPYNFGGQIGNIILIRTMFLGTMYFLNLSIHVLLNFARCKIKLLSITIRSKRISYPKSYKIASLLVSSKAPTQTRICLGLEQTLLNNIFSRKIKTL